MNKGKYTIQDVARELGVSCSTVSRAIHNSQGVSEEVRKKILTFAEQVGYFPNTVARNSDTGRLNVISLILGDIRNPFYSDLVFYIQKTLSENGYLLTVFSSEYDEADEVKYIRLSERFNFAGLILLTARTEKIKDELKKVSIPVVLVNRILDDFQADSVLMDNFKAGYMATMHLIDWGHSRIGYIHGQKNSSASEQRYLGYCQAMRNFGLTINDEDVFEGDLKMEAGYAIAKKIARAEHAPSGIVISNDMAAIGFLAGCKEENIPIPQSLSVVSFDNIQFSSLANIQLTTVSQHVENMGRNAAELMLNRLSDPKCSIRRIILDPELIVRKTTAPFNGFLQREE
jgi:Transcriptional regulators